ncbi:hypothetical protein [Corynebacterium meridianum]|nr:hypothetical protein [Corynebacterium meridianum]
MSTANTHMVRTMFAYDGAEVVVHWWGPALQAVCSVYASRTR